MPYSDDSWEKLLHIKTTGRDDSLSGDGRYPYEPTPYGVLERLSMSGYILKQNCLVDYGCGKGRVGLFLSNQTKCRTIGIDHDARLVAAANRNAESAAGSLFRRNSFIVADAAAYLPPAEADRFYFFNPFSAEILSAAVDNIRAASNDGEKLLFFYYASPEYLQYITTQPDMKIMDTINCSDLFLENTERENIVVCRLIG